MPRKSKKIEEAGWKELQEQAVNEKRREKEKVKPLTDGQSFYFKAIETSTVTLCTGPAGSGKSYIPCGIAAQMFKDKRVEHIVITRPLITCGKGMGFLPGNKDDKVSPYMRPLLDAFSSFFYDEELTRLIDQEIIEMWPLELMRGASIKNAIIICDEAQNADYTQLHMLLTRFGENTRVVVNGDASQSDLPNTTINPLSLVMQKLKGHPDIAQVYLTRKDIVRHPLIQFIDEQLTASPNKQKKEVWYSIPCSSCGLKMWYDDRDHAENVSCWSCGEITSGVCEDDNSQLYLNETSFKENSHVIITKSLQKRPNEVSN